jgi:hypothetical protein
VNIRLIGTRANVNLLSDANAFDSGSWDTNNVSVTADTTADPMDNVEVSSATADQITSTGSATTVDIRQTTGSLGATGGRSFHFYVWLKADVEKRVELAMFDPAAQWTTINRRPTVTTSWERYRVKKNIPAGVTSTTITVAIGVDYDRTDGAAAGELVYAWGAHLEEPRSIAGILTPNHGVMNVVYEARGTDTAYCDEASSNPGAPCTRRQDCPGGSCVSQPERARHSMGDGDADGGQDVGHPLGGKDGICEVCHSLTTKNSACIPADPLVCTDDTTDHNLGRTCTIGCHIHANSFWK